MPDCDARYLAAYLFEIGPTVPSGAGDGAISHVDLAAWMTNTGIRLNPWEARTLRRMSTDYLQSSELSKKPDCPAPWTEAPYYKASPNIVAQRMRAEMRRQAAM